MEPDVVTVVASAVASGAAAGLKTAATQGVKDAYAGLRRLVTDRYQQVDVTPVENKPESGSKRDSLAEDLADAGAAEDAELLAAAQKVMAAVQADASDVGPSIGINLERLQAAAVRLADLTAEDSVAVDIRDVAATGDIEISGIHAGKRADPPGPSSR